MIRLMLAVAVIGCTDPPPPTGTTDRQLGIDWPAAAEANPERIEAQAELDAQADSVWE